MNEDLVQIVKCYATRPHAEFSSLLLGKSKDNLISVFTDLLTNYINDKNSSSLREFVTVSIAGYKHNPNKLGYNGFKHDSGISGTPIACEAKPKNIRSVDYDLKKTKPKFNGEGGFNDYTPERLKKDKKVNLNLLSSGFLDGELVYILEFPFSAISKRLQEQLPKVRKVGEYKRMANFNFSHYTKIKALKVIYLNKGTLLKSEKYFNRTFFKFLKSKKDIR